MSVQQKGYKCSVCDDEHDNYHSHKQHGLCTRCRDVALESVRHTRLCCRCGQQVVPFTPVSKTPMLVRERFLVCTTCGLVLSRATNDRVQSIDDRYARADYIAEEIAGGRAAVDWPEHTPHGLDDGFCD